jgi:hypothetical protein
MRTKCYQEEFEIELVKQVAKMVIRSTEVRCHGTELNRRQRLQRLMDFQPA